MTQVDVLLEGRARAALLGDTSLVAEYTLALTQLGYVECAVNDGLERAVKRKPRKA